MQVRASDWESCPITENSRQRCVEISTPKLISPLVYQARQQPQNELEPFNVHASHCCQQFHITLRLDDAAQQ